MGRDPARAEPGPSRPGRLAPAAGRGLRKTRISWPESSEVFLGRSTKNGRLPVRVTRFCRSVPSGPTMFTMVSSSCQSAIRSTGCPRSGRDSRRPGPKARTSARSSAVPLVEELAEIVTTWVTDLTFRGGFGGCSAEVGGHRRRRPPVAPPPPARSRSSRARPCWSCAAEEGGVGPIGHVPLVDHLAAANLGRLLAELQPDDVTGRVGLLKREIAEQAALRRVAGRLGRSRPVGRRPRRRTGAGFDAGRRGLPGRSDVGRATVVGRDGEPRSGPPRGAGFSLSPGSPPGPALRLRWAAARRRDEGEPQRVAIELVGLAVEVPMERDDLALEPGQRGRRGAGGPTATGTVSGGKSMRIRPSDWMYSGTGSSAVADLSSFAAGILGGRDRP